MQLISTFCKENFVLTLRSTPYQTSTHLPWHLLRWVTNGGFLLQSLLLYLFIHCTIWELFLLLFTHLFIYISIDSWISSLIHSLSCLTNAVCLGAYVIADLARRTPSKLVPVSF